MNVKRPRAALLPTTFFLLPALIASEQIAPSLIIETLQVVEFFP
jgi:hypothetical protein